MHMVKVALWLGGLVLVVGIGAWLWFGGMLDPLLAEVGLGSGMQEEEIPQEEARQEAPQSELTTGSDTSDQALEQDLKNLDAQLGAYGETSAAVDQSLADEPVTQEY
jgi:hypothetical protein